METNPETKRLLRYFFENRIPVHIQKNNSRFYNGIILELEGDLLVLDDEKLGAMPIYILEIEYIEKRALKE